MANVVWPDTLCPRTFSLKLLADTRASGSVYGGSEIVNDLADDTWVATVEVDSRSGDTGATLEALVNYLQGGIHTTEFGHFARPLPRGTITATATSGSALKGADSLTIATSAGQAIKAGDLFEVAGLLLQCAESVTATTASTEVKLVNRLRKEIPANSTVNFNNPKIKWRLDAASQVSNLVGYTGPVSLSFIEDI